MKAQDLIEDLERAVNMFGEDVEVLIEIGNITITPEFVSARGSPTKLYIR